MEIWKSIFNSDGYEVSSFGNVRRRTENELKIIKIWEDKIAKGKTPYPWVVIHFNEKRVFRKVHRLVAESFCQKNKNSNVVDHINGNPKDNKSNNLRWIEVKKNLENRLFPNAVNYNKLIRNIRRLIIENKNDKEISEYLKLNWSKFRNSYPNFLKVS